MQTNLLQVVRRFVYSTVCLVLIFSGVTSQPNVSSASGTNYPPTILGKILDATATIGQDDTKVDLTSYFSDPDGDALQITAVSTNLGVASVAVTGMELSLTALSPGLARIKITADDGHMGRIMTMFNFTVIQPTNQSPIPLRSLPNQTATVGAEDVNIDLSNLFIDPDGDRLTFTAASSSTGVATVSVTDSTLKISPIASGTSVITIYANDGINHDVTTTFIMIVDAAPTVNQSPTVVNVITDKTTTASDNDMIIDLSNVFTDADGDPLTLTASSSTGVAAVSITGTTLRITPVVVGKSVITVNANDGVNPLVTTQFNISVSAGTPTAFISDYYQSSTDGRNIIQLGYVGAGTSGAGYTLEVYQYSDTTHTASKTSLAIFDFYPNMPYIIMDSIFYDFFDVTNAWYYNDEVWLTDKRTVALVLKKDGQTVDVLGDPNSTLSIIPSDQGALTRKPGVVGGTNTFKPLQWDTIPYSFATMAKHQF